MQVYARRAGSRMRRAGAPLPGSTGERQHLEGEELERFLEGGRTDMGKLAADIERHTGESIDGRVALDYGCGVGRLAVPLAERCEHVYGLDLHTEMFTAAQANAERAGVGNVEWMASSQLASLAGRYDAFISMWVLQHIPSREGERILAQLVGGLRPGGVGVFNFTVRPTRVLAGFRLGPGGRVPVLGRIDWWYGYQLVHSYSLSRIGEVLLEAGVNDWYVRWMARRGREWVEQAQRKRHPSVTLVFRKPG
jgi:2-polyprenyl-3-methyl-5-hydroxy-6-metoxy-1,4-benzoquinol methylase